MPNFGVNNSMKSFLLRFRWAIVLAVLQGTAFGTVGLIEHQRRHCCHQESVEPSGIIWLSPSISAAITKTTTLGARSPGLLDSSKSHARRSYQFSTVCNLEWRRGTDR